MNGDQIRTALVTLAVVLVGTAIGPAPAVAHSGHAETPQPELLVELDKDGSATLTATFTYDLETTEEQEAFESLAADRQEQQAVKQRFKNRMESLVQQAANETGRSMSVEKSSIELSRANKNTTGVVKMSIVWTGLAKQDGDSLTLRQPFASNYTPDRPVTLKAPSGYIVKSVAPQPDQSAERTVSWDAGTSLDGFRVVLSVAEDGRAGDGKNEKTGSTTPGQAPGVGPIASLLAVLIASLLALRFR